MDTGPYHRHAVGGPESTRFQRRDDIAGYRLGQAFGNDRIRNKNTRRDTVATHRLVIPFRKQSGLPWYLPHVHLERPNKLFLT